MDFNLKTYKCFKFKYYFKTVRIIFFFHGTSLNNENWLEIEQVFISNQLSYLRIFNTLINKSMQDSTFKNLSNLIHGPIVLLRGTNVKLSMSAIKNINPLIYLLCLKLNNKVYSKAQIKNVKQLSYLKNIFTFYKLLHVYVTMPYFTLKNKKKG